jgi:hypothetical protein
VRAWFALRPGAEQTKRARDTYHAIYKETKPLRKLRFRAAMLFQKRFYYTLDTALRHETAGKPAVPYKPGRNGRTAAQASADKNATARKPKTAPKHPSASGGKKNR